MVNSISINVKNTRNSDNSYYGNFPQNWAATTLETIADACSLSNGYQILNSHMTEHSGIKLIQPSNIGKMKFLNTECKYVSEEAFEKLGCTEIHGRYLLINRILSDGMKACILPSAKEKMITSADVCSISPSEFYSIEYLLLALSSPDFQKAVYENSSGTMLKRINKSRLVKIPFGLPPIKEQERIVSAVYSIFEQLDNMQY